MGHASESTNNYGVSSEDNRPTHPMPVSGHGGEHDFPSPVTSHLNGEETTLQHASPDDGFEFEHPQDHREPDGIYIDDVCPSVVTNHLFGNECSDQTL